MSMTRPTPIPNLSFLATIFLTVTVLLFEACGAENTNQVPQDRYAKGEEVTFLEQNWNAEEAHEFYSLQQGSPLMRRDFFNVLEQPDSESLFRDSDYLASFGFLPRRPHAGSPEGYPVGFTGKSAIELTCAACHTSRLTFGGKEYWIDGSQAMTDVDGWLHELVRAIRVTVADAPDLTVYASNVRVELDQHTKFGRFVRRLTGSGSPSVVQAQIILDLLQRELSRRQRYNDYNDFGRRLASDEARAEATVHPAYGYGRLDALGAILNQACAEHLDVVENAQPANAPVNYPAIWDAPQHDNVQWNGAVDNTAKFGPLGRNAGQVVGVFGLVEIESTTVGYDSSIRFPAIRRAEELITKLWSPPWPEEFGLDEQLAEQGKQLYAAHCIHCHAVIDRDDPGRKANEVLILIREGTGGGLGTDSLAAQNWATRRAIVGPLAGRLETIPFRGRFPESPSAEIPARDILSHVVFNTISRSFVPWRDELTIDDELPNQPMILAAPPQDDALMRYKARPLNGVWSTAPYLHNGSVLDMAELLTPPGDRRVKFRVGTTEFDPSTLGYKSEGPFEFDTTLHGNSNAGHNYGTELTDSEKRQLIEYVKTL